MCPQSLYHAAAAEWLVDGRNLALFIDGDGTLHPAFGPNRAAAALAATKQDSASGRSDSSGAIQFRKHDQWNKVL